MKKHLLTTFLTLLVFGGLYFITTLSLRTLLYLIFGTLAALSMITIYLMIYFLITSKLIKTK